MELNEFNIDTLSGEDFEKYVACFFSLYGYKVQFTKTTGDYGADLIITNAEGVTAIQVKRYSKPVGISAIQEVVAAKAYYNTSKCAVVTNNYFTLNAINIAKSNNVKLIDRDALLQVTNKLKTRDTNTADQSKTQINNESNNYKSTDTEIKSKDELFYDAIKIILENGVASTSIVQRNLRIGYNRAARLIEQLEESGIISQRDGSKPRKVLVTQDYLNDKMDKLNNINYVSKPNNIKVKKHSFINYILEKIKSSRS